MKQKFRRELEHGGDFVGEAFGRVEVAGIEARELLVFDGVAEVEFVGADDVAFGADAEEFAFDGVEREAGGEFLGEDRVEGGGKALAGTSL